MGASDKNKKKLSKLQVRTIIIASISLVVALALIITNIFIPVKYLFSFLVIRNKGAQEGVMRVRFVDVGFGDSIIIELPDGKNMLIDGGDGRASNEAHILKILNQSNINTIDYLICSSVNSEHCGGLYEILKYKTVKNVYIPYVTDIAVTEEFRDFFIALSECDTVNKISAYGEGIESVSGYFFKFLSPSHYDNPDSEYNALSANPKSQSAKNNASAVCWLQYGKTSFLFTSDVGVAPLEKIMENYLVLGENYAVPLKGCTVAQVAYHGGNNGEAAAFYNFLNPEAAVISVGNNAFGCPSAELISAFSGKLLYKTYENKTITFEVNMDGYKVV